MAKRSENQSLFNLETPAKPQGPVECLGMTFENDEARREHFLGLLREGLEELHAKLGGVPFTTVEDAMERMKSVEKWPMGDDARLRELAERMRRADSGKDLLQRWKDEVGFPHGEIEDILNLSDPPYYTACPNPFIADFIKRYGKPYDPETDDYRREPFAADVSEGKNDPIYNAHSYHTKVPHKAIMRYILHYTEPGDVVFDGFCGTGMTGVAAQLCGDRKTVESLGYKVDDKGVIYQQETDENGKTVWKAISKLGARRAILNDLSPAATFIAYNYNTPVDVQAFEREAKRILKEVEEECGWMYRTLRTEVKGLRTESPEEWAGKIAACKNADEIRVLLSPQSSVLGTVNYTVWSDVFVCPECTREVVFWEAAVDKEAGKVHKEFPCPHCGAMLTKRNMDRAWVTRYDKAIGQTLRQAKQVPVLINYSVGKKRYEKAPDAFDLALIEKIEELDIPYWFPTDRMPEGEESRRNDDIGLTHVHHFYTKRNLWVLGAFLTYSRKLEAYKRVGQFWHGSILPKLTKMNRYMPQHGSRALVGPMVNTLYISPLAVENDVLGQMEFQKKKLLKALGTRRDVPIATRSAQKFEIPQGSVDYIFTDPPFGANIMYSELNFLREAWLKVFTNNRPEAIENKVQGKGLPEYQRLMTECFREYHRLLKPGRWMTVEFHNSRNSVWNSIQEALQTAGFVVADIRILDKTRGGLHSMISQTATKQDLVISAYKPNGGLEERFKLTAGTEEGVWDFARTHLRQLPVAVVTGRGSKVAGQDDSGLGTQDSRLEIVAERQNYLLFDRMVAFHVQRGVTVPLSAAEFYAGLAQRFPERDGMYFLPEQVAEYDKKRTKVKEVLQLQLFVTDEASAIQWLKQQLTRKPQTFQELHPQFLREIGGWQKHEKPLELSELLEQNFLRYDGKGEVPSQIHSYLSSNFKELRNLPKDDERLRAKAKDRWYVPDPNKAGDLEKLRERALLREFEEYRESKQKRLKVFRLEAVRAGFKKAWQERDYATIIAVARKIPENVLQEDPKLLMWYDQALTRMGEQ
jgi:DNA modification methylase